MRSLSFLILTFSIATAACTPVLAAAPQAVNVTGSVIQSCTTWTPSGSLTFSPTYDVFSATVPTGSASLTTNCTKGATVTFAVNGGQNFNHASPRGLRAMTDGSNHFLSYQLYQDSGFTTAWAFSMGTGAGTTVNETGLGNAAGESMTLNLFGQLPAKQDAFVSSTAKTLLYQDTITATVNF
jgi:spore coat protein U-like protein